MCGEVVLEERRVERVFGVGWKIHGTNIHVCGSHVPRILGTTLCTLKYT